MKKVLILALFMLAFATGCATKIDLVGAPEDAYVYAVYAGATYVEWTHIDGLDDFRLSHGFGPARHEVHAIKPGKYTITDFNQNAGGNSYMTMSKSAQDRNTNLKQTGSLLASFEVKAGEVTYIGDFIFTVKTAAVKDNFDAAVEYLTANYPDLDKDKIVKALIVLGEAFKKKEAPTEDTANEE